MESSTIVLGHFMINWAQVNELRDEVGAEDFEEVVALFLEEVQEIIDELRGAPNSGELESKMHFLKGSALNLGFKDFSDLCAAGEKAAADGRADEVDVSGVLTCYDTSRGVFLNDMDAKLGS